MKEPIEPGVRRFLANAVPSVPYLGAALLLLTEPEAAWDAQRMSARRYVSPKAALELLKALCQAQLAMADEALQAFRCTSEPATLELLRAVARTYASHLLEATSLIHGRVDDRAKRFADAFKFKKD